MYIPHYHIYGFFSSKHFLSPKQGCIFPISDRIDSMLLILLHLIVVLHTRYLQRRPFERFSCMYSFDDGNQANHSRLIT